MTESNYYRIHFQFFKYFSGNHIDSIGGVVIIQFIQLVQYRLVDPFARLSSMLLGFQTRFCLLHTHVSYLVPAEWHIQTLASMPGNETLLITIEPHMDLKPKQYRESSLNRDKRDCSYQRDFLRIIRRYGQKTSAKQLLSSVPTPPMESMEEALASICSTAADTIFL